MTSLKPTKGTAAPVTPAELTPAEADATIEAAEVALELTDVAVLRDDISEEVLVEIHLQDKQWGQQNLPNGTGAYTDVWNANVARSVTQSAVRTGTVNWRHVLDEEVKEAFAEADPIKLRAELIQAAAVTHQWIAAIDRALYDAEPKAAA
jgi:ribonuclease HI